MTMLTFFSLRFSFTVASNAAFIVFVNEVASAPVFEPTAVFTAAALSAVICSISTAHCKLSHSISTLLRVSYVVRLFRIASWAFRMFIFAHLLLIEAVVGVSN